MNQAEIETMGSHGWIRLSSGLYVAEDRMRLGKEFLTLDYLDGMNVDAFNRTASAYGVNIGERDLSPLARLVKVCVFLSRKHDDKSFIPDRKQYVDMALEVMYAKAMGAANAPELTGLYDRLTTGPSHAAAEVLDFYGGMIKKGEHRGKYHALRRRFDENGRLGVVGDVMIPGEGWIRAIDIMSGYPTSTEPDEKIFIENIGNLTLLHKGVQGYWKIGEEPRNGEERIIIQDPDSGHGRFLDSDASESLFCLSDSVGAIRLRR
jgi:hypothetical protein